MVQRLKIESLCDFCMEDDGVETIAEHTEVIGIGTRYYELQWCEVHDGKISSICDLINAFRQYGHKPDESPGFGVPRRRLGPSQRPSGELPCPFDDCDKTYNKQAYLDGHIAWHNGYAGYGCDQPNCQKTFTTFQAVGLHKQRAHGIASPYRDMAVKEREELSKKDREKALALGKKYAKQ